MIPFLDIPEAYQERVVCSIIAAIKYEVPVNIVLAVSEKEGGKPYQWVKNSDGSFDVGAMQFNTNYLKDLKKYGITSKDVENKGCYAYDLAAWRLRLHEKNDHSDIFTSASNYHSRTPKYNQIYRIDLIKKAIKWAHWLNARFMTYDVTKPGIAPLKVMVSTTTTQKMPIDANPTLVKVPSPHGDDDKTLRSYEIRSKKALDAVFSHNKSAKIGAFHE